MQKIQLNKKLVGKMKFSIEDHGTFRTNQAPLSLRNAIIVELRDIKSVNVKPSSWWRKSKILLDNFTT
jgi:hypothetical protein